MAQRARRLVITSAVAVLAAALVGGGWLGRRSLGAAWLALRHPELVERSTGADAESCGVLGQPSGELDELIALEFQELEKLGMGDPDHGALAGLTTTDLPVAITRRTLRFVRFFGIDPVGRKIFRERLRRSGLHRAGIEQQLREAGLPEDLVWVPAVESSFDPQSVSPAGAAGMWQFMPETAALYGLEQTPWLDERRSLTRATEAAVAHLRDLYERLGSWDLGLAAYNMGYDGILRALQAYVDRYPEATAGGAPPSFVDLARARLIPAETADYVPKIAALAIVAANLTRFDHDDVDREPSLRLAQLAVPEGTALRTLARSAGMSLADLRLLNPDLLRDRVPPTGGDYLVTIPAERLEHARASLPAYLDNEILELESTTALPAMPEPLILGSTDDAAPLPAAGLRRPAHLGHNRLPAFPVPGRATRDPLAIAPAAVTLETDLPMSLTGIEVGWQRPEDPLALLREAKKSHALPAADPELERHLAFLSQAPMVHPHFDPFDEQRLPNGLLVRMRHDPEAARVAIALRWAAAGNGAPIASDEDETRYAVAVNRRNLDAGIHLAIGRLAAMLGTAQPRSIDAVQRELDRRRRAELEDKPDGRAWLALGDALFADPSAGPPRLLGPDPPDGAELTRRLTLGALRETRQAELASLTMVGNFDTAAARIHLRNAIDRLMPAAGSEPATGRGAHERTTIRSESTTSRLLYAWSGPEPGTREAVALDVAMLVLSGPKESRFRRELLEPEYAASARGFVDPGWPHSAVVLDLVPTGPVPVERLEQRLGAILADLRERGPSEGELAYAKAIAAYRLRKRSKHASEPVSPDLAEATLGDRVVDAFRPGLWDRSLAELERVTAATVRDAARTTMASDRAVVVVSAPDRPAKSD